MTWLDLAIVSVSLWGGIEGYFQGCWRMTLKTLVILAAMLLANLFKRNFVVMLVVFFSMEEKIKTVISDRLLVPVSRNLGGICQLSVMDRIEGMINELSIPLVLKTDLLIRLYKLAPEIIESVPEGIILEEWLTRASLNIIAFGFSLILWAGWLNLVETTLLFRHSPGFLRQAHRWGGAVMGLGRHFLLISLVIGVTGPILWFSPWLFLALEVNNSLLASWSLNIFKFCKFWW